VPYLVESREKKDLVLTVAQLILICLTSLYNKVIYIQFCPAAYIVKLNIELSMASLITMLARGTVDDRHNEVKMK
jgi:hypothetical protein